MKVAVGVDGGQSQIRVAICGRAADAGRPGAVAVDGVAHSDGDTSALVADRVASAWRQLREPGDELHRIVLGLTTLPAEPDEILSLAQKMSEATEAREVWLMGDAVVAHAGALPAGHGVVMVVGTGIACLAVDSATGDHRWVDGDGFLLGDKGASFWMGSRGIAAALASADGRGEATSLRVAAEDEFGAVETLAARLHARQRPVNAIAQFAAVVQEHAAAGDAVAREIVEQAASEIVASIRAAATLISGSQVPVAILGRAAAPGTTLRAAIARVLSAEANLVLTEPAGSPLDGACALAASAGATPYDTLITRWRAS